MNWYKRAQQDTVDSRRGYCYELAWRYVLEHENAELVHGITRKNSGDKDLNHAWVEEGDKVFDPVLGQEFSKEEYYQLYDPIVSERYSHEKALVTMVRNNHMGPWNEQNPPKKREDYELV